MTQRQRADWLAFCERFNLDWEFIDLGKIGVSGNAPVLKISTEKNPTGMLIFPPGSNVMHFAERLRSAGYGFSVVEAPRGAGDRERFPGEEMLADWGLV